MPNRLRPIFKDVSRQLQRAARDGEPTLLVVYDATPFRSYSHEYELVQAMFGQLSVDAWVDEDGETRHSETFYGGNRSFTLNTNTSVSAVGLLKGGPEGKTLSMLIVHNPFAKVQLNPRLFDGLPIRQIHALLNG